MLMNNININLNKIKFIIRYIFRLEIQFIMGIGDWGLGIGDWGLGPIPNRQCPIVVPI